MKRFIGAIAILVTLACLGGCSETGSPSAPAPVTPQVQVYYPPYDETSIMEVHDSTQVYLGVENPTGAGASPISQVLLLFSRAKKAIPDTVGLVERIDLSQVPDSVQPYIDLPEGWSLYRRWWFTGPKYPKGYIRSGEFIQLYAMATDDKGRQARSNLVKVRILNLGEDLTPPFANFTITPSTGTFVQTFEFDPSPTVDSLDTDALIRVRWDFDGNGWDVDWDQQAHADDIQQWKFRQPGTYIVVMQAINTYLPDTSEVSRSVVVSNLGGTPHPPNQDDYIRIDASADVDLMGATTYKFDGQVKDANSNEGPVHRVILRQPYFMSKYEVTNQLYLDYLRAALAENPPKIDFDPGSRTVRYHDLEGDKDTTWVLTRLDEGVTKIYYDLDHADFRIKAGYENHPVTGVTWYGAYCYCIFYGLRLPTEAEWEVAARGTHSTWAYPFSEELTAADGPKRANYSGANPPFGTTTPVGFYNGQTHDGFETIDSPSVYGLYDMSGNVAEWVNDWYADNYPATEQMDPQGPISGSKKIDRGGSYQQTRESIRATQRNGESDLEQGFVSIGFRPAYTDYQADR